MDQLAVLFRSLKQNHKNFTVHLMEQIFEEILRGLERNDFKEA